MRGRVKKLLRGTLPRFLALWAVMMGLLVGLNLIALAVAAVCFFAILRRRALWREPWRLAGALVLAALLPLAVGFAQIISPFSDATPIMKHAYVFVYVAVLLAADLGLSFLPRP